jgi:Zn-dependent protease
VEESIFRALIGYIVFMFSVVCHEAGHALAALWGGDKTAYHNGQVTLNPIPHIQQEPFGLGLLPIISLLRNFGTGSMWIFGFASAPFDPAWGMAYPRRAAWMAMAGPAANFLIALVSAILMKIGLLTGFFTFKGEYMQLVQGAGAAEPIAIILSAALFLNFSLGCFNLIPVPPLDGFSMLLFFVPPQTAYKVYEIRAQFGLLFPILIFVLSQYLWDVIDPLYAGFVRAILL